VIFYLVVLFLVIWICAHNGAGDQAERYRELDRKRAEERARAKAPRTP
jgi:hypothetical protein